MCVLRRFPYTLVIILFAQLYCFGQYSKETRIKYTVNDGLPSSTCYDLKQDKKGYIWIATEGGLSKFDGISFQNYSTQDGLVDNEVIELSIDSKDRIWMNTNNKLSYMYNDSVYTLDTPTNHMLSWNFDIMEHNDSELWIARMNTLNVLDINTLEPLNVDRSKLPKNSAGKIWLPGSHEDRVWVVDNNFILYEFKNRKVTSQIDLRKMVPEVGHYNLSFRIVYPFIYYSGKEGINRLNLETKENEFFCSIKGKLRQIEFHSKKLFVLTDELLNVFNLENVDKPELINTLMKNEYCSNMIIDADNNLWGAIYRNGVYFYPPAKNNLSTLDLSKYGSNNLESVTFDDGKIIAGSAQGELYIIDGNKVNVYKLDMPSFTLVNRILDIVPLGEERYLVAFDIGLFLFINKKFERILETIPKSLYREGDKIIISSYRRTKEIAIKDIMNLDLRTQMKDEIDGPIKVVDKGRTYSAIKDREGNYWIGNSLEGLKKHNDIDTLLYRDISDRFKASISRIIQLENGLIAIATMGEGVLFINDKEVRQLTTENGLTTNFCYDICADGNRIFVSTNRGAHIVELESFDPFEASIDVISTDAGLKTNEVIQMAYAEGNLFIATNEGLATLDLEKEQYIKSPREMHIDNFLVNGIDMPIQTNYQLEPSQNSIKIHYNSPQYIKDHGTLYSYKMEGIDKNWISTTTVEAYYRNLDAGNYEFKYRLASRHQDDDQENYKSIKIEIKPYFVDSFLFKLLAFIGISLLIFFPTSFYLNKKKQQELTTMVEEKTIEVKEKVKILEETNLRLQASNEELEQFAYIASHDLQEPINTISGFSEILKNRFEKENNSKVVDILNIINNSSTRMKILVQDLLDFSRLGREKERVKLDLDLVVKNVTKDLQENINANQVKLFVGDLPDIKGYEFEINSLFLNLISNAIKYQTPNSSPIIRISCKPIDNKKYEFSVKDNGIGISKENQKKIFNIFQRLHNKDQYQGTGIGLAQCKKIVELHGGEIWVESEKNEGSNFKFTLEK